MVLDWEGKGNEKVVPECTFKKESTYGDPSTENMLIHGDNLVVLKELEKKYSGKIKCIFIDPPYNTGKKFKHYDDNLSHPAWLSFMRKRLVIMRDLLSEDGSLWITLDDREVHYLKVVCDEVFGRENFLNQVSLGMKKVSGASGGGEDLRLKKTTETLLIYTKDIKSFKKLNPVRLEVDLMAHISNMRDKGSSWKYTNVLLSKGVRAPLKTVVSNSGGGIDLFTHKGVVTKNIKSVMKDETLTESEVYLKYHPQIYRTTNAQSSIRTKVISSVENCPSFLSIDYTPRSGKHKGKLTTKYYLGNKLDMIAWLCDITEHRGSSVVKLEKLGTYWEGFPLNNLTKEGGVKFAQGKKPEKLIKRILSLATNPGDLVLDAFLGSGTTAAVAHKMGRKWIGVELGEHINTHCVPRLNKVIDGEDKGGITKETAWEGGGGYSFYSTTLP